MNKDYFQFPLHAGLSGSDMKYFVVGRMLDADDDNRAIYLLKDNNGALSWWSADVVHSQMSEK